MKDQIEKQWDEYFLKEVDETFSSPFRKYSMECDILQLYFRERKRFYDQEDDQGFAEWDYIVDLYNRRKLMDVIEKGHWPVELKPGENEGYLNQSLSYGETRRYYKWKLP